MILDQIVFSTAIKDITGTTRETEYGLYIKLSCVIVTFLGYDIVQSLRGKMSLSQEIHGEVFRGEVLQCLQLTFEKFRETVKQMWAKCQQLEDLGLQGKGR